MVNFPLQSGKTCVIILGGMRELAEKIKLGTVTPGDAGSVFFARAAELGADDKRRFLDAFLSAAR